MRMEIEVQDSQNILDLIGVNTIEGVTATNIPGGAELRFLGSKKRVGVLPGLTDVLVFSLTFGASVSASLVANWLYDKFKRAKSDIRITYTDSTLQEKELTISVKSIEIMIANASWGLTETCNDDSSTKD